MPTVAKFRDTEVAALNFERELADLLKRRTEERKAAGKPEPKVQPTTIDYFESRRQGLALVLSLSKASAIWSRQFYIDGRPRRQKIGNFRYAEPRFPKLDCKAARTLVDKTDLTKVAVVTHDACALPETFDQVCDAWLEHHVDEVGLRTAHEIRRILGKTNAKKPAEYIPGSWRDRKYVEIKRKDIIPVLRKIKKERGARTADTVLTILRSMANWYATEDDDFSSPFVKGMRQDKRSAQERRRDRALTDQEIVEFWKACDQSGQFGSLLQVLLLTAQRRAKVASMKWSDLDGDIWVIDAGKREKIHASRIKLPLLAISIIEVQPRLAGNPYVFASERGGHLNCWNKPMAALRKLMPKTAHFHIHDLRRSARSLMARLGVGDAIAEKALGHALSGVLAVYNVHDYFEEKSDALERVANHIAGLVDPSPNVVKLNAA